MMYTHVLNRGGLGVQSPADLLDLGDSAVFTDSVAGGIVLRKWVAGGETDKHVRWQ